MRIKLVAMWLAMAAALPMLTDTPARAASPESRAKPGATSKLATSRLMASELSAQTRRPRARVRIYREDNRGVYPSYNPGPNAVRDCTATYVEEHRPSGTVIVPRMNCFWRPG